MRFMPRRLVWLMAFPAMLVMQSAIAIDTRFSCGGSVEQRVWSIWDTRIRRYAQKDLLESRLGGTGDVYALYDFQGLTQNLVDMARRCGRMERLREIATVARTAYDMLDDGGPFSGGRRWICRGGTGCAQGSRLWHEEIVLCSVQFLGLVTALANALAYAGAPPGPEDRAFIERTRDIAIDHLRRWDNERSRSRLRRATVARREDIANDSSLLLFTDTDLWQITVYAELAGILRQPGLANLKPVRPAETQRAHGHVSALLAFFNARLSRIQVPGRGPNAAGRLDLDRGYWAGLRPNRYATYQGTAAPVVCRAADANAAPRPVVRVPPETVPLSSRLGWDISHARRFVPAVAALERNREAMAQVYAIETRHLPPADLGTGFAATLVDVVWNGDPVWPLFANFWSGDNGWYRVAWDDGSGKCHEGYPPYALSEAFATGGYLAWTQYQAVIGELGQRLFLLLETRDSDSQNFLMRYYPVFAGRQGNAARERASFTFFASLVGTAG